MNKKIEREVAVFDNETDEYVHSIPLNSIPVEEMIPLIIIDLEYDPKVYNCYELNQRALNYLSKKVDALKNYDLEKYSYSYETTELQSYREDREEEERKSF